MCPDVLCLNEMSGQTLMQSQARILYHSELRNMKQLVRPVQQGKATLVCYRGDRPSGGMFDVVKSLELDIPSEVSTLSQESGIP